MTRKRRLPLNRSRLRNASSSSVTPIALLTAEPMSSQKGQPMRVEDLSMASDLSLVSTLELSRTAPS